MAKGTDRNRVVDWTVDRITRALIALARAMPYRQRVPFFGWLMRRVIAPLAGYRKRALTQIAWIWPELDKSQRRRIADAVAENFGRTLIENYSTDEFRRQMEGVEIEGPGLAAIEAAREAGRPAMLVTGHFGNYEAIRHCLNARGLRAGALYRPMQNPFFNTHYVETLTSVSGPMFPQGREGLAGFRRYLDDGGIACLLFDIWYGQGELIDFLGQPAPTSTAAAGFALKHGAVMVPLFAIRQPDGMTHRVTALPPIPPSDPATMTREATRRLEEMVQQYPGQWLWFHRRWKPERREQASAQDG